VTAIAGCGGGSTTDTSTRSAAVDVDRTSLGRVLADVHGRTLYLFAKDTSDRSTCSGACATVWPPLLTGGRPVARAGAASSQLGTTRRAGFQVTYRGHPLYHYSGDEVPGETNGQELDQFGAFWYAVSPAGKAITRPGSGAALGQDGAY
jgi:predicted lipoprotein with Yx(FWY)xxD motif